MKTLGLIGGMSWQNTIDYYRKINQMVNGKLGGWSSAKILLYSVNFAPILQLENAGYWEELGDYLAKIAKNLEKGGAQALMICSNTMHKVAEEIEHNVDVPLIHVVDATAKTILTKKIRTVALLGTQFTMEQDFYVNRLEKLGMDVYIPPKKEREYVHNAIYNELSQGHVRTETKRKFIEIIEKLVNKGSKGLVMGCTEIPLIIKSGDVSVPIFDTMEIHLKAALRWALS